MMVVSFELATGWVASCQEECSGHYAIFEALPGFPLYASSAINSSREELEEHHVGVKVA
jgi:hypothetical protein